MTKEQAVQILGTAYPYNEELTKGLIMDCFNLKEFKAFLYILENEKPEYKSRSVNDLVENIIGITMKEFLEQYASLKLKGYRLKNIHTNEETGKFLTPATITEELIKQDDPEEFIIIPIFRR